jgi:hypothetical protein
MKKQTQQILYGVGALVALGGVIYFYRKSMSVSISKKSDEDEGLKEPEKQKITQDEPKSIVNLDYIEKAKTLQGILGFKGKDIDGDIGANTQKRLAEKGITYQVTPSNIDAVIAQLKRNISEPQLIAARKERATQIARLASTKKVYTWTDKDANIPVLIKDALGKYNSSNQVLMVNSRDRFKIPVTEQTILSSGFIRARIADKDGRQRFIVVSPYSITIY